MWCGVVLCVVCGVVGVVFGGVVCFKAKGQKGAF